MSFMSSEHKQTCIHLWKRIIGLVRLTNVCDAVHRSDWEDPELHI